MLIAKKKRHAVEGVPFLFLRRKYDPHPTLSQRENVLRGVIQRPWR